jgi:epoxyqueuosine reductase
MNPVELAPLFSLSDDDFRRRFRRTPLWRAKRRGVLRNAAIVLGNHPHEPALPALIGGLNDPDPLVRGACAWALKSYDHPAAREALRRRAAVETDADVLGELRNEATKTPGNV